MKKNTPPTIQTLGRLLLWSLCLVLWGCDEPPRPGEVRLVSRPATKPEVASLANWSLTLNGVPFEGNSHKLKEKVRVRGMITPRAGMLPRGLVLRVIVALRPAGTMTDEPWHSATATQRGELVADVRGERHVDEQIVLDEQDFPPGEYDARLYLQLFDIMRANKHSRTELLATGNVAIGAE